MMNDVKEFAMQLLMNIDVSDEIELTSIELNKIADKLAANSAFCKRYEAIIDIVENAYVDRINEINQYIPGGK